jgi:hypothetical protein
MAQSTASSGKKSTNPLVFVGVGCLVLIVLLGVAATIVMKFFAHKVGVGMLQGAIESKTGVKTNLTDLEKGKLSFTDPKTGAKIDIGSGKIPETFPKDFPIYSGAKVTSVMSGAEKGESEGFWLTLSSTDSLDKVSTYYKNNLKAQGWEVTSNYSSGDTNTQTVSKGMYDGSVAITRASDAEETQIIIILGQDNNAQSDTDE